MPGACHAKACSHVRGLASLQMLSCVCYCTLPRQPTTPFHLASIETTNPLKLDLVQALPSGPPMPQHRFRLSSG